MLHRHFSCSFRDEAQFLACLAFLRSVGIEPNIDERKLQCSLPNDWRPGEARDFVAKLDLLAQTVSLVPEANADLA
jgi:hypothetical protein